MDEVIKKFDNVFIEGDKQNYEATTTSSSYDELIKKFDNVLIEGDKRNYETTSASTSNFEDKVDDILKDRQKKKRTGAKVFCVSCGAVNRTLRKWHNSYLCTDCFKIAQNVGDEKFIKALKGEET